MLNQKEIRRYARHLSLDEVGVSGQEKLKSAKVLVIGAGGLGCPILQYLTAAGVGSIGIVDYDIVDESNLQRQIIYNSDDVGMSKVTAAISHLSSQNAHVNFVPLPNKLNRDNVLEILQPYDIVIDGTDNFPTRYLVNDASIILGKPLIQGSIYKFEGQVAVFNLDKGPSYRCLYPDPPNVNEVPNCSEMGVIGVLPGVIGTRMATECLKLILGIGDLLKGKVLFMNLLTNEHRVIELERVECNFERTELEPSYDEVCIVDAEEEISPEELKELLEEKAQIALIDVREDFEFQICKIRGSVNIPLGSVMNRIQEIPQKYKVIVICHHGVRSAAAIEQLRRHGFNNLINLSGGIHTWATEVDSTMATY